MATVLVTGADGKLAEHLIPILASEGYDVIRWGREIDLNNINALVNKVASLPTQVDAFVSLAGAFEPGFTPAVSRRMYAANVATFVNVLGELEEQNQFAPYPTIVAIGHPFDMTEKERSDNFSYFQAKDQVKAIIYGLDTSNQYATIIEPNGAIDTPEKRDDIAFRIVDAINTPVTVDELEELDNDYAC